MSTARAPTPDTTLSADVFEAIVLAPAVSGAPDVVDAAVVEAPPIADYPTATRAFDGRGRTVQVCASGRCIMVTLIDWCLCGGGRTIDLYSDAYRRLAPLSTGTQAVRVGWW